jgi:hypothetical protein
MYGSFGDGNWIDDIGQQHQGEFDFDFDEKW